MSIHYLQNKIDQVAHIANLSKLGRLLRFPGRYIDAITFWKIIYPRQKKERLTTARLFFDRDMRIALPAATDIYLTGGKSHPSEIKLARYLVNTLGHGDSFLDIGAHYGYFSMLAATLAGNKGHVYAYEPASAAYALLEQNAKEQFAENIRCFKEAVSDEEGELTFYEFPNLYSEYNSMDTAQFGKEQWFKNNPPAKVTVPARTIDIIAQDIAPKVIKIDVEGAEDKVIAGGKGYLTSHSPCIVMEYLGAARGNDAHKKAEKMLLGWGYKAHAINKDGTLTYIPDTEQYMSVHKIESDNIVFKK